MSEQPRSYWRSAEESRQALDLRARAVEAAARALFGMAYDPIMWDWDSAASHRQTCISKARLALAAAVPLIAAEVWDEGMIAGVSHFGQMHAPPNPYEERKMTPAEIEEWRRTCPYPEALGK